jgi:hypothetical protein
MGTIHHLIRVPFVTMKGLDRSFRAGRGDTDLDLTIGEIAAR